MQFFLFVEHVGIIIYFSSFFFFWLLADIARCDAWECASFEMNRVTIDSSFIYPPDLIEYCKFSISQELKESFNYGLFCPPSNGKAGKFLDEERRLGDYPFNGPVGYLEVSGAQQHHYCKDNFNFYDSFAWRGRRIDDTHIVTFGNKSQMAN